MLPVLSQVSCGELGGRMRVIAARPSIFSEGNK